MQGQNPSEFCHIRKNNVEIIGKRECNFKIVKNQKYLRQFQQQKIVVYMFDGYHFMYYDMNKKNHVKQSIIHDLKLLKQSKTNLIILKRSLPQNVSKKFLIKSSNFYHPEDRSLLQQFLLLVRVHLSQYSYERSHIKIYENLLSQLAGEENKLILDSNIYSDISKNKHYFQNEKIKQRVKFQQLENLSVEDLEKVKLPNIKYLEDATFFYQNWKLSYVQTDLPFITLEENALRQKHIVERALCSIANTFKGGFVLIGISKNLLVTGLHLKQQEILKKIQDAVKKVIPCFDQKEYKVDFIPVLKFLSTSPTNKYIGRVHLHSSRNRQLKFLNFKHLGHQQEFQFPKLVVGSLPKIQLHSQTSIYKLIYQQYKQAHSNKQIYFQKQQSFLQQVNYIESSQPIVEDQVIAIQNHIFRHKNSSILYVTSNKKLSLLQRIFGALSEKHIKYNKQRVYEQVSLNSQQSTWLISHEDSFQAIESIKNKIDPAKKIPFFSVHKHIALKIKKQRIHSNQALQELKVAFLTEFKKKINISWIVEENKQETKELLVLLFESFSQSLFSFVFLMSRKVWAIFYKQSKAKKYSSNCEYL